MLARLQAKEDAANKDGTGDRGMVDLGTWGPGDGDDDPILQLPLDIGLFLDGFLDGDIQTRPLGCRIVYYILNPCGTVYLAPFF